MVARRVVLCLLLVAAVPVRALAPHKRFHDYVRDVWSIEQGLPQISALAIVRDAEGYVWVGTQAGLARFDGNRFVSYTEDTAPGLSGNFVNDLLADAQGRLWIGTYKGLSLRENGRFVSVPLRGEQGVEFEVQDLALGPDGLLVAGGTGSSPWRGTRW